MKTRSIAAFASVAALLTLGLSAAAQAQPVYWSVGLSSPGVQLVYVEPRPVVVAPQPVYYVRPVPVYVPPPRYIRADWRHGGHRPDQRFVRWEHDRRG